MFDVVATKPPTLTDAPGPNSTPFGLTSHTCPLAARLPWMSEAPGPWTRLSVMALRLGCWNWTLSPLPTEKLCQLTIALADDWVTVVAPPDWEMPAWPAATVPCCGPAVAVVDRPRPAATRAVEVRSRARSEAARCVITTGAWR